MALPEYLQHYIRVKGFLTSNNISYVVPYDQVVTSTNSFYYNKPTVEINHYNESSGQWELVNGINYNKDIDKQFGYNVYYSLHPFDADIISQYRDYLPGGSYQYKWELRIITQNQWRTKRNGAQKQDRPVWQSCAVYTPWDLNDPNRIVGFRGNDLMNADGDLWDRNTNNSPAYKNPIEEWYRIKSLASEFVPASTGYTFSPGHKNHQPYITDGFYCGWGYPAVVNLGNSKIATISAGQVDLSADEFIDSSTIIDFVPYRIDTQYQTLFGNASGSAANAQRLWNNYNSNFTYQDTNYSTFRNAISTYSYKVNISYNDIIYGKEGILKFPIILKAAKTLLSRQNNQNSFPPDSYHYTVALVCYNNQGQIVDIICDTLRIIDLWDVQRFQSMQSIFVPSMYSLKHTQITFLHSQQSGSSYYDFGPVDYSWVQGNFQSSITVGGTFYSKLKNEESAWLMNHMSLYTNDGSTSHTYHDINNQGTSSITCSYVPISNKSGNIRVSYGNDVVIGSNPYFVYIK